MRSPIILTGAAGFLGNALIKRFCQSEKVVGTFLNTPISIKHDNLIISEVDLTDNAQIERLVLKYNPSAIVNSAAWVDVDGCEGDRERALKSNYETACVIADVAGKNNKYLLQISTDYIFNGKNRPGCIKDSPDPLNYYGRTKLLAEEYISKNHSKYLIARTCSLMGTPNIGKTNLLNYFYNNLSSNKKVDAPDDIYANPIWINNLADLIYEAVIKQLTGVVHLGGDDYLSRFEFAKQFAKVFNFNENLIYAVSTQSQKRSANRPKYAGLDISDSAIRFSTKFLGIKDALMGIKAESE